MASARADVSPGSTTPRPSGGPGRPTDPAALDQPEPVLCGHCGRTASNGIVCQGICVSDSGY